MEKGKQEGCRTKPHYPASAIKLRQRGTVVLGILVSPESKVESVEIIKSSGYKKLDIAAVDAAKKGCFNTHGVWTKFRAPIHFNL
ncbi:hypothetical protein BG910_00225 [Neisseria chenwenguii]|uniref:TonB C-terminal domain-containing protein n=1 Tax=Neisseria chenwenguii TaxID=1853278 RepID=A0A220RZ10_9NEIS|nr:hypothetical protein BG910_00225 [Neisseria chenwenguii]